VPPSFVHTLFISFRDRQTVQSLGNIGQILLWIPLRKLPVKLKAALEM